MGARGLKVASIPARESHLEEIIYSQTPYVDKFEVYLNNYDNIPGFLKNKKIQVYTSQQYGDIGDCGKFFKIEQAKGYVIFFDDDLCYPKNYVEELIKKIDLYQKSSLICVHGNILPICKLNSYYKDKSGLHFAKELLQDTVVDVPGTGTLGLHTDFIKIPYGIFKTTNMTDLWLGLYALQNNIAIRCIARADKWLQEVSFTESIRHRFSKHDSAQTELANTIINLKSG